jgi:hypothetical protein
MELGGSADVAENLVERLAGRDAAGEVRHIGREIPLSALDHNCVTHALLSPKLSLSENALQRARVNLIAGMPGHRDQPAFVRMLILPMISARPDLIPAVVFDHFDQVPHLHLLSLARNP